MLRVRANRSAPTLMSSSTASSATRTAVTALRSLTTRAGLASGSGGATSNAADYHFTTIPGERAFGGSMYNATVGFSTGAASSYAATSLRPVTSDAGARILPATTGLSTGGRHAAQQTWGGIVGGNIGDRAAGAATNAGSNYLMSGGEFDPHSLSRSAAQGFVQGGSGPIHGLRVAD